MSYNKKLLSKMIEESKQKKSQSKPKDRILDPMGQWKFPGQVTRIPSNRITMQGVPYPVLAKGSSGEQRVMYPDQEYFFPDSQYVDEYPLVKAQNGLGIDNTYVKKPLVPILIGPANDKDIKKYLQLKKDETWGSPYEFMMNWYSNPITKVKLKNQRFFDKPMTEALNQKLFKNYWDWRTHEQDKNQKIAEDIWKDNFKKKWDFQKTLNDGTDISYEKLKKTTAGFHVPKDSIIALNERWDRNEKQRKQTAVHEISHATPLDEYYINYFKTKTPNSPKFKEKEYFHKNPDEIYPRIMDLRYQMKLRPGRKVTPEMLEDYNNDSDYDLKNYYSPKELAEIMNEIAYNPKKQLIKAQNGIDLNLPKYNKPEDRTFSVNPYTFGFNPDPGVNIFGIGVNPHLNLLNKKKDKLALTGDVSSVSVGYPGGYELFGKPQGRVGLKYTHTFKNGGDISIPNLEEGGWLDRYINKKLEGYQPGGQYPSSNSKEKGMQDDRRYFAKGADQNISRNYPVNESLETGTKDSKDFLKNWYTERAKNPYFTDIATKRLQEFDKVKVVTENSNPKGDPLFKSGVAGYYDPTSKEVRINPNNPYSRGTLTQIHEIGHHLYDEVPQNYQENIILDNITDKDTFDKSHPYGRPSEYQHDYTKTPEENKKAKEQFDSFGYEYHSTPTEVASRLLEFRKRYNIDPNHNYTPKEMKSIIDAHTNRRSMYLPEVPYKDTSDEDAQSGDTSIDELLMIIGNDPTKLSNLNTEIVYEQPSQQKLTTAKFGGWLDRYDKGGSTTAETTRPPNDGVVRIKIKNNDGTFSYLRSDSKEYYDLVESGAIDESSFNKTDTAFSLKQKPKKVTQQPITKKQDGPSFLDNLISKFTSAINEAPLDARGITMASGFKGLASPSKINIQDKLEILSNKLKNNYDEFVEYTEGIGSGVQRFFDKMEKEDERAITKKAKTQSKQQLVKKDNKLIKRNVLPYGFTVLKDEDGKDKIVRDVKSTNPKDSLVEFMNVFNNDLGVDYIVGNKVKEITKAGAPSKFSNVQAVGHFLRDSDILPNQKIAPKTWNVSKGYKYTSTSPGKALSAMGFDDPERYRMLYKKKDDNNRYTIKYVKNKDLTEEQKKNYETDFTVSGYHNFSDVDWDTEGPSTGYKAASKWLPLKNKKGHTYIPYKDKNAFSRFSGGSITYLFRDPLTGENLGVDVGGSVTSMKKVGEDIIKMYNIKPEELKMAYHDMGSYSAKPKAKDGVLDYNQWIDYNTYNRGFSGAPLMIPIKKSGGQLPEFQDRGEIPWWMKRPSDISQTVKSNARIQREIEGVRRLAQQREQEARTRTTIGADTRTAKQKEKDRQAYESKLKYEKEVLGKDFETPQYIQDKNRARAEHLIHLADVGSMGAGLADVAKFGTKQAINYLNQSKKTGLLSSKNLKEGLAYLAGIPTERSIPRMDLEKVKTLRQIQDLSRMKDTGLKSAELWKTAIKNNLPEEDFQKFFGKSKSEAQDLLNAGFGQQDNSKFINLRRNTSNVTNEPRTLISLDDLDIADDDLNIADDDVDLVVGSLEREAQRDALRSRFRNIDNENSIQRNNRFLQNYRQYINNIDNRLQQYVDRKQPTSEIAKNLFDNMVNKLQNYPYYSGTVNEKVPNLSLAASGNLKNISREVKFFPDEIKSGDVFTGSTATSHSSYLPQLKQVFKYTEGSPQFLGYKPMNELGYLSRAGYSSEDIAKYLNTEIDEQIKRGILPSNIQRPFFKKQSIILPHYGVKQFNKGGQINWLENYN